MPAPLPQCDEGATPRPASCRQLFWVFTRLALQGFGGVLPIAQRELVERERWLSREHFLEMLALAQVLPGPNVVNLALMVGQRFFGHRGAAAAMSGMLIAPLVVVLALAALAAQWQSHPLVSGALRGMGLVAAGLIIATAVKLAKPLAKSPLTAGGASALAMLSLVAVGVLRWPLAAVVLGLSAFAWIWAWCVMRRSASAHMSDIT